MSAGSQYAERSTVPPRQVELPPPAIDTAVEAASTPVLPQYVCRYVVPGRPGAVSGSSVFMCEYRHTVRKMPSPSALGVGRSPVFATRATPEPGDPFGILSGSKATPGGCEGDAVMAGPSRFSGETDGLDDALGEGPGGD